MESARMQRQDSLFLQTVNRFNASVRGSTHLGTTTNMFRMFSLLFCEYIMQ